MTYTIYQAIQEGFILDVIANYTPVDSFYHVAKTIEDDPQVDKLKALKKIRRYVESHDKAIRRKAEIMVDHFTAQVIGAKKIGGNGTPAWHSSPASATKAGLPLAMATTTVVTPVAIWIVLGSNVSWPISRRARSISSWFTKSIA